MSSVCLRASGLVVGYGREPIIRGVNLKVAQGEIVGLVGANGAGKTTLFRALAGQLRPMQGQVMLVSAAEIVLTRMSLARRARLGVGYLPQRSALLWDLTVRENLKAARRSPAAKAARGWRPSGEPEQTEETLMGEFDLSHLADVKAAHLSGGQTRRVELARLKALGSRFLLCDEPLAGLDTESAVALQRLLVGLAEAGCGILVADHRAELFHHLCHRLIRIENGTSSAQAAAPDELRKVHRARTRFIPLGQVAEPVSC